MKQIITNKILEWLYSNQQYLDNSDFTEMKDEIPQLAQSIVEEMKTEIEKMQVTSNFIRNSQTRAGFQIALNVLSDLLEVKEK